MGNVAAVETAPSGQSEVESFKRCLQDIARYYGRPASETVLFSGVPLPDDGIEPVLVERICERIGLDIAVHTVRDVAAGKIEFPALVEFADGRFAFLDGETWPGIDAGMDARQTARTALQALARQGIRHAYSFSVIYLNSAERAELGGSQDIERGHWLFGPASQFWRGYANIALAALFINLLGLASPIFIMNVYDRVLPNKATSSLLALAAGVALALLFDLLLKTARSMIIDHTGRAIDLKVSHALFDKVLHTSMAARPASTGEYANRVSQFEFVREFFTSNTVATLIDALFVFVFLFVIFLISGWLFVIPLAAFTIAVTTGLVAQYRISKRVARAANESAQRQSLLVETISTIETVKSLRAEAPLIRKWNELTKRSSRTSEEIKQLSSGAANFTQFVQQSVSIFIVIAGAYEFAQGRISTGAIIATVMLSGRTVSPMSQIALTLARMRQAMLSLRILDTIMAQEEDRPNTVGFVHRPVTDGSFAFQNVSFQYPGSDAPVLRNLSFSVRAGERIGIIGKIGSGKTTLGRLLANLYIAQEGRVLINGVDVRQYHPAEVRSAVAYAGQSADLFSGTLKENLQLANADATDEEIVEAAKKTGVDEFAAQHPRGYDLAVGERGSNLSGGQKQAVAITRLLLSKPKIVFLDEPSGAMDMATEKQLIGSLARSFDPGVTLVISTHRYSLLELVDRLIVLDRGAIVADGPKDKVLGALAARANAAQGKSA
ncbi:type I secretion system permease/ATPase [Oricola nitratireducens]|uniref:type I secretion system permease/ATPase n=1 Tax=Oricola nitratireducens TaxID=2775868 RepID=UPI00186908F4|nr:type I secretion system permease/ATPase [Oricola nitratireducens]